MPNENSPPAVWSTAAGRVLRQQQRPEELIKAAAAGKPAR